MTDHAARALVLAQSGVDCFSDLEPEAQESAREHCRAVLRAIREPSEAMAVAGLEVVGGAAHAGSGLVLEAQFTAMIDAAISGEE